MTNVILDNRILLDGGSPWGASTGPDSRFYLEEGGLDEGWYAPAPSRVDWEENPSDNGSFIPDEWYLSERVFSIRGYFHSAGCGTAGSGSSMGEAEARRILSSLHNKMIDIAIEDQEGTRYTRGAMTQKPVIRKRTEFITQFTLFVTCPDPLKYGREVRLRASGTEEVARQFLSNPLFRGTGDWAEVARNYFTNPDLVGDGTWAETRRNLFYDPMITDASAWFGGGHTVTLLGNGSLRLVRSSGITNTLIPSGNQFNGLSGVLSVGYTVRNQSAASVDLRIAPWDGSAYSYGPTVTVPAGQTRVVAHEGFTAPSGAAYVQPRLHQTNNVSQPVDLVVSQPRYNAGTTLAPFFDPSAPARSLDPDMRQRWLGAENASPSVMEIERVRGANASRCIAGVSTRDGKPAMRLIKTADGDSFVTIPKDSLSNPVTLVATSHIEQTATSNWQGSAMFAAAPWTFFDRGEAPGPHAFRIQDQGSPSAGYRLTHSRGLLAENHPDIWWSDIGLYAGIYNGPNVSGGAPDRSIDPDMRTRFVGAANASASVMEIERVSGWAAQRCIAGVSSRGGKPAARLIATVAGAAGANSYVQVSMPSQVRQRGTLAATRHQDALIESPSAEDYMGVRVQHPTQQEVVNRVGATPLRLFYEGVTSQYVVILGHGGAAGSPDVYYTDAILAADEYSGPAFSGSSPNAGYREYRWLGPVNASYSVAVDTFGPDIEVENTGDEPTWPVIYASGRTTIATVQLGDYMVAWQGLAPNGFVLDPRDGIAIAPDGSFVGRLAVDDVFKIPPGKHLLRVQTDGRIDLGVAPAWQ